MQYGTSLLIRPSIIKRSAASAGSANIRTSRAGAGVASARSRRSSTLPPPHEFSSATKCFDSMYAPPLVSLRLPAPVNCPFSVHCHPEYESIKWECDQWALSLFEFPSQNPNFHQAYLNGLYPLFTASFYPSTVTRERMVLLINLITWLFVLDDTIDASDPQTASEIANGFVAVVTSKTSGCPAYKTRNARIQWFLNRFSEEVWDTMCRDMSPDLQGRLVREMLRSMGAMKEMWQLRRQGGGLAGLSESKGNNDTDEIIALRLLDSFAWPLLVLLEYSLGIELPRTAAGRMPKMGRLVHKMAEASAKQLVMVNDMFSSAKELANMDAQSLLGYLALQQAGGRRPVELLDRVDVMQDALRVTWHMIQEQERICEKLLHQIRNLGEGDSQCVMYAEGLCNAMSGNLFWSTRTWRYNGPHPVPWNSKPSYLAVPRSAIPTLNVLGRP